MLYCVIRGSAAYKYQDAKHFEFIHSDGRNQYIIEGLIVGFALAACGASLAAIMTCANVSKIADEAMWRKIWRRVRTSVRLNLLLAIFIYAAYTIYCLYTRKTQWYSLTGTLPSYITRYFNKRKNIFWWLGKVLKSWTINFVSWANFKKNFMMYRKIKQFF